MDTPIQFNMIKHLFDYKYIKFDSYMKYNVKGLSASHLTHNISISPYVHFQFNHLDLLQDTIIKRYAIIKDNSLFSYEVIVLS